MATGEKNGPDQPIRSSRRAPSLYKLSLLQGGPSPPLRSEESWKEDHSAERERSSEETEAKEKRNARSWLFLPNSSRSRTVCGPQCPPRGPAQAWLRADTLELGWLQAGLG